MPKTVLVTLAIGPYFQDLFRRKAESSWREYAERFGHELIVLTEPLDTSGRARDRSPAWQKCLIPSQKWAEGYDRIVWLDCDIVINNQLAPDIVPQVPAGKVGGVTTVSTPPLTSSMAKEVLGPSYYTDYGLPLAFPEIFNTGVLVYQPELHAALFRHVYDSYEEPEGNWHYEQRPLSWHIVEAGLTHSIDRRFNKIWAHDLFEYFSFLAAENCPDREALIRRCLAISFPASYFFHFAGMQGHMEHLSLDGR